MSQKDIEEHWAGVRKKLLTQPAFQLTRTKEDIQSELHVYEMRVQQLKHELKEWREKNDPV